MVTNNQSDPLPETFTKTCYMCGKQGIIRTDTLNFLSPEQIWITIAFRRWFCPDHVPNTPEREQAVKEKEDKEEQDYQAEIAREAEWERSMYN